MLRKDPSKRSSVEDLLVVPYLKDAVKEALVEKNKLEQMQV